MNSQYSIGSKSDLTIFIAAPDGTIVADNIADEATANRMLSGLNASTIDRDAVIEECARWFEARYPMMPVDEMRNALKSHPIMCVCGEPSDTNVVHRSDAPCYCKSQPAQPCSKPNALQVAFEKIHGLTQPDQRDEALNLAREALALAKSIIGHTDDCGSKFIAEALDAIDALKEGK